MQRIQLIVKVVLLVADRVPQNLNGVRKRVGLCKESVWISAEHLARRRDHNLLLFGKLGRDIGKPVKPIRESICTVAEQIETVLHGADRILCNIRHIFQCIRRIPQIPGGKPQVCNRL